MTKATIGFAMCGSFCTFSKALPQMEALVKDNYRVLPIMSQTAYTTDTRFGRAEKFREKIAEITGEEIIHTIDGAEPIGPKKMCDAIVIAPCTGNTMAKIANGVTDTSVTMAIKSHLRIQRPVLTAIATNDGLGASAQNIGKLLNVKNIFFVPFSQDDCANKPNSLVAHFDMLIPSLEKALAGEQIQPVFR